MAGAAAYFCVFTLAAVLAGHPALTASALAAAWALASAAETLAVVVVVLVWPEARLGWLAALAERYPFGPVAWRRGADGPSGARIRASITARAYSPESASLSRRKPSAVTVASTG